MSSTRPKRKATANKSYVDSGSDSVFDSMLSGSSSSSKSSISRAASQGQAAQKSPKKRPAGSQAKNPHEMVVSLANGRRNTPSADPSNVVPYNWQPPLLPGEEFSHKLNLADATVNTVFQTLYCPQQGAAAPVKREEHELKNLQNLLAQNVGNTPEIVGPRRKQNKSCFQIKKGDYIYMVSEPPGEPYYIGCVKGFKRKDEGQDEQEIMSASLYQFQIQWFYRPRDISKHTSDSRLLFASMHSDTCPLSSFRGLLTVLHRSDVEAYFVPPKGSRSHWASAVEFFSSFPNCFYFDKLYDRYILKFYDVVKTSTLLQHLHNTANCSKHYILALNKRFDFVAMEPTRTKGFLNNFTSTMSTHCDVCAEWCGLQDSVTCAGCEKNYHMLCLDPPLIRKPSRGFSWSCALCTKKHELEYESRKMLMLSHDNRSSNEQEISNVAAPAVSPEIAVNLAKKTPDNHLPKYEKMAIEYLERDALVSVLERRLKEEWNIRYLGLHARLEEAVDLFDKSYYPRVSTSLGQRYQVSNIPECDGHPLVYYDPDKTLTEKGKKKASNGKKPAKKKVEADDVKALPIPKAYEGVSPKDFPQWLQPRPQGYIERGEDDGTDVTCTLQWKPSESDIEDNFAMLDAFVASQSPAAEKLGLHPNSPNFADAVVKAYMSCNGNTTMAAQLVSQLTRASLKEPTFTKEEVKKFEAGVKKHGSELYPISKEVKTQPASMVVRFYYIWKKTPRGHQIWGTYPGRKKKPSKDVEMKIKPVMDDYADSEDDSSYENEKIVSKKKQFQCKHCKSYQSQKWFKITGFDGTTVHDETGEIDDFDTKCVIGLCFRCAKIWRRYAVYWEDPVEVEKKNVRGAGGYRKKIESELVVDAEKILYHARQLEATISFEPAKSMFESSVIGKIERPKQSNGSAKPMPAPLQIINVETSKAPVPKARTPSVVKSAPRSSKSSAIPANLPNTAIDEAPVTRKVTLKAQAEEPTSKKRKVETKQTPEPAKAERKKRPASSKPEASKPRKKKAAVEEKPAPEVIVKKEPPLKTEKTAESKAESRSSIAKRQRKNADATTLLSPIYNPNYRNRLEEVVLALKNDKKGLPPITKETLGSVLDEFKFRQLLDMKSLTQGWQAPQQARIDLPFAPHDRKCSICLETDGPEPSFEESLICSNCGVNIHASCAGITVSGKNRPIKQWLCDPCVNDMKPKFDTDYSCSICVTRSTDLESALTGNPLERPDFLVPVLDSGKWCHLICALYCHDQISVRHVQPPSFISKEIIAATATKSIGFCLESVSRIYVENFDKRCEICKCLGGGLVKCDSCESNGHYFHATCAQATPHFKLGLKVDPCRVAKSHTSTFVGDQVGTLEPVLLCPKHSQNKSVLPIREPGKRSSTGEAKPLIQLLIEDLIRHSHRLSGPQLRAQNYASMIDTFMRKIDTLNGVSHETLTGKISRKCCSFCRVESSPKWWPLEQTSIPENSRDIANGDASSKTETSSKTESHSEKVVCQKCHFLDRDVASDAEGAGDTLIKELNEPLSGANYGVNSVTDKLRYVPHDFKAPAVERSKITWGDLLG